ncbi:MAG TPA: TIGR01777 family oxidoreductase [Solirubrobacterales bacterium]|nr:TIGR01777 family oxidoreductase [Solirubrobacterales bacterium]
MRVLVTGASGMIGSSVCDALLARGDEVVGLTRDPARARSTNPTIGWHPWNPTLERPPEEAFAGVDGIVNVIGESINQRWTEDAKRRIRESRVIATHNLVQAISAADPRPRVLVSQSAVGYYGDRGDAIVDEGTPAGTTFDAELCADWEAEAHEAEKAGIRVVVVRSAPVLDRRGGLLKQVVLPFRLGLGGPIAGGKQYMPWIHIDDEVRILLWPLDEEHVSGTINASAPNPVTNHEFSHALGRVLRRPAVVPVPKLALWPILGGELADAATSSLRVVPRRALDLGFEFRHPEIEPALHAALGE